jgi:superfamily I DNA/RNA helicase
VDLHPSVADRLHRLAPDQRSAATAPPGPILCVAPAGSGKTTTLVARVAWLIATGAAAPSEIAAITFNRRAAEELEERLVVALEPLGVSAGEVRVRTFHALGREILADAGRPVEPVADRAAVLRGVRSDADAAELRRLDTAISRLKLDLGVTADDVAADPEPGPTARTFLEYEAALRAVGSIDFDDFVAEAVRLLATDDETLGRWRDRCRDLLVDEAQDLDRAQLRLGLLLAAPANRIFLVGDDDQSIYGWRLADVRRILGLAADLPGLRRVDLEVNYRCPRPVVERAVRLVALNRERFPKRIAARRPAPGRLILAPDGRDEAVRVERAMASWPSDGGTQAVLARTNRELLPAIVAAIDADLAFRPPPVNLLVGSPLVDAVLDAVRRTTDDDEPLLVRLERVRARLEASDERADSDADPDEPSDIEVAAAILAWAAPFDDVDDLAAAIAERRGAMARLCRDDAPLTFATAHATKGLEFDHVAVVGMDDGRFPSARSIADSGDPLRALEEERRLAYVAWTRARRSLTLVYDAASPSPFLLEAFEPDELGLEPG